MSNSPVDLEMAQQNGAAQYDIVKSPPKALTFDVFGKIFAYKYLSATVQVTEGIFQ